ncbi:flavodoxin family protein [Thiomicrorhabdus sp. ZW0627]|uniref:flavodoxin family protein n=1 Tax=Thiomicrorhabdus sp. ZW0627 TaxID=3039774 RepID=UPI002436E56B|nr:flavodoxin family protein [Thiomicrorhabdus sp. ZW0627]MDG6774732.1 flavodoxin family protein [Thiomicrorhabdus sp. ZW0627]
MKNFKTTPSAYIVYASDGGKTKALAEDFTRHCRALSLNVRLLSLNDLSEANFAKSCVIFFIGSRGNGEFPSNGEAFLDSAQFAKSDLSSMRYALFALGSRFYGKRTWAGRKLYLAFKSEQACSIMPPVFAEDEVQESYRRWASRLLSELSGSPVPDLVSEFAFMSSQGMDRRMAETDFMKGVG